MPKSKKKITETNETEEAELRRGPWTLEEDDLLTNYIAHYGEGRWNLVANRSGLKRSGKSCRLRWLNYLKPDIKRGNLSPQEQLMILQLHSRWGNRWSKIAQHLPGRTDNEIKNYWRTRVQKQARQLNIDSNSEEFFDAVRSFWMPRLIEKIEQNSSVDSPPDSSETKNDDIDINTGGSVFVNSGDSLSYSELTRNSGSPDMNCSSSISGFITTQQLVDSTSFDQSTTGSMYMHGGSGCGGEEDKYGYFDNYVAAMGNLDISSMIFHVDDSHSSYEDVTKDAMWNIDDIWQFRE